MLFQLHLLSLGDFKAMLSALAHHSRCELTSCHAQPVACSPPLPRLASSRPTEWRSHNHTINIVNAASTAVQISWLAANGTARPVFLLAPGERRAVRLRTGDAWQAHATRAVYLNEDRWNPGLAPVSGAGAQLLMQHLVGPTVLRDCHCPDAPLLLCPPRGPLKVHNHTERPQYEPAGWMNLAGTAVEVYLKTPKCEMLLQRVEAGGQLALSSRLGQVFRIRRAEDQRLLLEQTIGELWIRPCETETRDLRALARAESSPSESAKMDLSTTQERVEQLESRVAELEHILTQHRRWTGAHVHRLTKYLISERRQ